MGSKTCGTHPSPFFASSHCLTSCETLIGALSPVWRMIKFCAHIEFSGLEANSGSGNRVTRHRAVLGNHECSWLSYAAMIPPSHGGPYHCGSPSLTTIYGPDQIVHHAKSCISSVSNTDLHPYLEFTIIREVIYVEVTSSTLENRDATLNKLHPLLIS